MNGGVGDKSGHFCLNVAHGQYDKPILNATHQGLTQYQKDITKANCMSIKQELTGTIIIQGVTEDGRKFRPSDWAERMSGMMSTFGDDHRIHYSSRLRPITLDGNKCIALDTSIRDSHPAIFRQIMDFAERNQLIISQGD